MTAAERPPAGPGLPPGWQLNTYEAVGSTNDEARALAAAGAPEGSVVWAHSQQTGRGRRGRQWDSPPGNLYCSVLLRPTGSPQRTGQLPFVVSLALARAVAALAPELHLQVKWPNDVLIGGAKISGILLEGSVRPDGSCDWVIIGTGINVAHFPEGTEFPATSIAAAGASDVTVEALLEAYLAELSELLIVWGRDGFAGIRRDWITRAWGMGHPLVVRLEDATLTGVFEDLDEDGHLMLRLDSGEMRRIAAGDVFFPRA